MSDETHWQPWERNFIGQMVRQRERLGMRQTDLAKALRERHGLKFHQQTVARIEEGSRAVRLDEAFLIAKELQLDPWAMTAAVTPDADIRFSGVRVRRDIERVQDYEDDLRELLATLSTLVGDLADHLPARPEVPLAPVVDWGLTVATWGAEVARSLFRAMDAAGVYGTSAPDRDSPDIESDDYPLARIDEWAAFYADVRKTGGPGLEVGVDVDRWLDENSDEGVPSVAAGRRGAWGRTDPVADGNGPPRPTDLREPTAGEASSGGPDGE